MLQVSLEEEILRVKNLCNWANIADVVSNL